MTIGRPLQPVLYGDSAGRRLNAFGVLDISQVTTSALSAGRRDSQHADDPDRSDDPFTNWVGGRQPHRDAAGLQARDAAGHRPAGRSQPSADQHEPGAGHHLVTRRFSSTARPTRILRRRDDGGDALFRCHHADGLCGRDDQQRRRQRRSCGRVHLRPRAVIVYNRRSNPAWSGQERDGLGPIRTDDLFFGGSPATSSLTGWI